MSELFAARWARVSSRRQSDDDRNGLPFQRTLQDEGLAALQAEDTGIAWEVAASGATIHQSPEYQDMLKQAGRGFNVLLVGYVSRLGRNAMHALSAVDQIQKAGAQVYFCEERLNTADETSWESFAREVVESEAYRRRLSRTMKRTYESRWRRLGLPAGVPPYGYNGDWTLNEEQAATVRTIFETYAQGLNSLSTLARVHSLPEEQVKVIIRNPAYTGLAQHNGELIEGKMPVIVDRDTWNMVVARRAQRRAGAPGPRPTRRTLLRGRTWCACGQKLRLDGQGKKGTHRIRHLPPLCSAWGKYQRKPVSAIELPIMLALSKVRVSDDYLEDLVARINAGMPRAQERPDTRPLRARLARMFAQGELAMSDFSDRIAQLDAQDKRTMPTREPFWVIPADLRYYFDQFSDGGNSDEDWITLAEIVFERIEWHSDDHLEFMPTQEAADRFVPETIPGSVLVGGEGSVYLIAQPRPTDPPAFPEPSRNTARTSSSKYSQVRPSSGPELPPHLPERQEEQQLILNTARDARNRNPSASARTVKRM